MRLSSLDLRLPLIRPAGPADAGQIAAVHVASFRDAYGGLLPPARLERMSVARCTLLWDRALGAEVGAPAVFVAEARNGIRGFVSLNPQRSRTLEDEGFDREVSTLYVLPAAQGRGLGRALMSAAAHHLLDHRGHALSLWALKANRAACGFYESLGGELVGEYVDGDGPQWAYGWIDPVALL